jgi:hypothetical protein
VATKTKGRKNREIPMDVLNPEVREILLKLCHGKKPDDYVFGNPETDKPFTDIKRSFHTACRMARIDGLWWHDLTRHVLHASSASWIRGSNNNESDGPQGSEDDDAIIRAVQLQRQVRSQNFVHKLAT